MITIATVLLYFCSPQLPSFTDCGCVMQVLANASNTTGSGISPTATTGLCDTGQCQLVGPFLVLVGIGVLILYSRVVPLVFVTLRYNY